MLSNAYFLAKFRFDTAENEPAKILQNFANFANPNPNPLQVLLSIVQQAPRVGEFDSRGTPMKLRDTNGICVSKRLSAGRTIRSSLVSHLCFFIFYHTFVFVVCTFSQNPFFAACLRLSGKAQAPPIQWIVFREIKVTHR